MKKAQAEKRLLEIKKIDMKTKTPKKKVEKKNQIVEIHIYVYQQPNNPNAPGTYPLAPWNPPYIVTC